MAASCHSLVIVFGFSWAEIVSSRTHPGIGREREKQVPKRSEPVASSERKRGEGGGVEPKFTLSSDQEESSGGDCDQSNDTSSYLDLGTLGEDGFSGSVRSERDKVGWGRIDGR